MQILAERKIDLLYLDLYERKQQAIKKRRSEDIALDIGKDERILGIEIIEASQHLNLDQLLPLPGEMASRRHYHG